MDAIDMIVEAAPALGYVVAVGLLFGVGLPVLFALGIRSLDAAGRPKITQAGQEEARGATMSMIGAGACFGLCVLAVVVGIVVIIWGEQLFGA